MSGAPPPNSRELAKVIASFEEKVANALFGSIKGIKKAPRSLPVAFGNKFGHPPF